MTETRRFHMDPQDLVGPAGLALGLGRLVITLVRPDDRHLGLEISSKRTDEATGRMRFCPLHEAEAVYLDVRSSVRSIGTYRPARRTIYAPSGGGFDDGRLHAALIALRYAVGQRPPEGWSVVVGARCFVCGNELTDPASIDLGIGPYCAQRMGDFRPRGWSSSIESDPLEDARTQPEEEPQPEEGMRRIERGVLP